MVLLHPRSLWLKRAQDGTRRPQPGASQMRDPRPFVVIQNAKLIFTVYARSLEQAQAIVAAKVAGETIVVAVPRDGAAR
jgi:hypothetical protein